MIFAVFDPSPLTVCINCSFYIYICLWRRVNDFNPTFALAADLTSKKDTSFLLVSDYINCIALLCLNKYVCMYVCMYVCIILSIGPTAVRQ